MLRSLFASSVRPRAAITSVRAMTPATSIMTPFASSLQPTTPATVSSVRTLLKTHKGTAQRWRKMGNGGYKRVSILIMVWVTSRSNLVFCRERHHTTTATLDGAKVSFQTSQEMLMLRDLEKEIIWESSRDLSLTHRTLDISGGEKTGHVTIVYIWISEFFEKKNPCKDKNWNFPVEWMPWSEE